MCGIIGSWNKVVMIKKTYPKRLAMAISIGTLLFITAYELLKQYIFPNISLWESHAITILLCTMLATIAFQIARRNEAIKNLIIQEKTLAIATAVTEAEKKRVGELQALNQQLSQSERQSQEANQKLQAKELELMGKIKQTEQFNKVMVGRELVMVELKKEINELLAKSGQVKKYEAI